MRRIPIISAAVVAALATGGILAVSGGAQAPTGQTIQFSEKTITEKFVDAPPRARGENAGGGDMFLFSNQLRSAANKRVGTLDAKCTFTRGGRSARGLCEGVFALPDGDLYASARLSTANNTTGAITGGTRAYVGARGTFTTVDPPNERSDPQTTITLLP
jgi:hypothetical protein